MSRTQRNNRARKLRKADARRRQPSGGAAKQVQHEQPPESGTPQVSRPPGSSAHNPAPDSVSRPPGIVAAHTTCGPEHGKYPPDILDILGNNWYAKDLQERADTLERVVSLEVVVSEGKTVGGLPLERPLENGVEKDYSCLHWYAISRVGSHLVKSKKDDANIGQEKKERH